MGPDSDANGNLCVMCREVASNSCSGCHSIRYCSTACQKIDWPVHKLLCKDFKDFKDDSRPTKEGYSVYKRAIFFAEGEDVPRFIWLRSTSPDVDGRAVANTSVLGPNMATLLSVHSIKKNGVLHRNLSHEIMLVFKIHPLDHKDVTSEGVPTTSLSKIDKELSSVFKGPLLAFGSCSALSVDWPDQCYDFGVKDFRHVVDWLRLEHYREGSDQWVYTLNDEEKVQGLRLNCWGDIHIYGRPAFEPIEVSKSVCDMENELNTEITAKLGVPLITRKIPIALAWRGRRVHDRLRESNPHAACLDLDKELDTSYMDKIPTSGTADADLAALTATMFGMKDELQNKVQGSMIVVRKGGKPLKPVLMSGLQNFIEFKLDEVMFCGGNDPREWKDHLLATVTREEWEAWYKKYVDKLRSKPVFKPEDF
ncbi:hypothetical protein CC86DRAFT_309301 [Ophiobolus disseminans]|uniref:MYND-type domain-containing protein n=1 Tax=Ophiobolus disseminans TaxID=1469910 RepID=A0A6A6ZDL3_9PLEO|nr:hypothetical protein CC86DRAFT_309301 [Ophiobolus disseminans]